MRVSMVMTLIGKDRPGLVQGVASAVEAHGGNWEESRMVRLGGEFAGLLRVRVAETALSELEGALRALEDLTVTLARADDDDTEPGELSLELRVVGQDHPGIVHGLSQQLAAVGVNVEEIETEVASAPMSGERMFQAQARLRAPAGLDLEQLQENLERLAGDLMVEIALV